MDRGRRGAARVDLDQGDDREQRQGEDLRRQQADLGAGRELDPDHHDRGHDHDPDHADDRHGRRRGVDSEQLEAVEAGDLRQVGHHDDVGDDDHPAGDPAELRAHRLGHPGEAGAAVGVGFVQVVVAAGDQEHRDEADQQDRRRLQGDRGGDEAERRGEAVAGGGGGDADDDAGDEADRVLLQPLVFDSLGSGLGRRPGRALRCSPTVRLLSSTWPQDRLGFAATVCPRRTTAQVANVPKAQCPLVPYVQVRRCRLTQRPLASVPSWV